MLLNASTTTRADASVVTPAPGQELTLLAVVASASGTPTGNVTFYNGITNLGNATLSGGIARLTVASGLPKGTNETIQASYSGDGNFTGSTGNLTLTVAAPTNYVVTNELDSVPQAATDQNAPLPDNTDQLVRYADGVVTVSQDGPSSAGFGFPWAQTISWSNGPGYSNGVNGNGWVDTATPELLQADGQSNNTLVLVSNGNTASDFTLVNGSYQASFSDTSLLTYNSTDDIYTLIDPVGDQIVFYGFTSKWLPAQRGQFASFTDPYGTQQPDNNTTITTSYTDGHITEMTRSVTVGSNTTTESWLYSYLTSGPNAGLLSNVTLGTQVNGGTLTKIRQIQYTYYDGTQQYGGNIGDLMTATIEDGSNTPNVLDTSYYRYYTSNSDTGYTHGLEYVFSPDSYLRMTAANPDTSLGDLTDSDVLRFADNYFQYDSQQRVKLETVQGGDSQTSSNGLATYQFSYTPSTNPAYINYWSTKTVVTNPDASTDTVYTNFAGEVMLDDHHDQAIQPDSDDFYTYNLQGQVGLHADPSAVTGYSDSNADLLHYQSDGTYQYLSGSSGLVTRYGYYTSTMATDTTAGYVASYLQEDYIQMGQTGGPVYEEYWQYYAHSFAGQTIVPIAAYSVFRFDNDSGTETTNYTYSWYSGTAQMQSETETPPIIPYSENGSYVADVTTTLFDAYGNAQWIRDPDGFIERDDYDPVTGALLTQIVDDNTNLPNNWTAPSNGGLNLTTTYVVDALGRTTEEISPDGNITYYVYLDPEHEERIYQGWNAGAPSGPTQVIHHDAYDGYDETFTMTTPPLPPNGVPDGTEAISGLQTLTRDYTNAAGQVVYEDAFFNFGTLTYNTLSLAQVNVNYYQTNYGYDSDGNLVETVTPNVTIYRTVYNSLGEKVSAWVGTNDTPSPGSGEWSPANNTGTANMVEVSSYAYDIEGNQTQEIDYPGLDQPDRETDSWYDWRDRLVAQKSGVESQQIEQTDGVNRPIIVYTYDNLDEVTETQQYDGDGMILTTQTGVLQQLVNGQPVALDGTKLRAQESDSYDEQGRVYQTQVYDVDPTTGAWSSTLVLTTNDYYDHRGDLIAESEPGGLWTKSVYDGAGRDVMDYTTDGRSGTYWVQADNVTNDTVLEQDQTVYDNDGNVIETIDSQRFNNVAGYGALGSPSSGVLARVSYAASYYDNADRLTASVDVGTNHGSAWMRPGQAPTSSPTVLTTKYDYNSMGLVQQVTDPMGFKSFTVYDNLGRTLKTIAHYTGAAESDNSDIATEYGYDGNNNVVYVQADEPNNAYQKTVYIYGVTTGVGPGHSGVNSNDILAKIEHPDPSSGLPSTDANQQETYLVNAVGENVQYTDRGGNVHEYTYDVLGRETADTVTQFATGVDPTVKQHTYAYDSQGNQYLVTSLNASGGIVNQVEDVYNGLDQLTVEYQSHSGQVNTSSTPKVQYHYNEMQDSPNNSRLEYLTYPDGYQLDYNYNSGLDSTISRLSSLVQDSTPTTLESYKYLGLDTVVERDHPQINVNQTYITTQNGQTGDGGDPYVGLDRFGRVVDENWVNTNTGKSTDDFQYGYDQDSDVLSKQDVGEPSMNESYQYDNLNRLTGFQRGTSDSQGWTLDALGNMTNVTTDGGTPETRTVNQQNELTNVSDYGNTSYDANGNLTNNGNGNSYIYDAWNHLVEVDDEVLGPVAFYSYDGLGRLIVQNSSLPTDLYYSSSGQVLEEYVNVGSGAQPEARNVWSPVYVNALVLRDESTGLDGNLKEQRLYVEQDANWNVTAVVDGTNKLGAVLERYDYLPYGAVTYLNPDYSPADFDTFGLPNLWQGMEYDPVVKMYFSQSGRVEKPDFMTWMQTDYIGFSGGDVNLYRIVGNNPTNEVDPSGLRGAPGTTVTGFLLRPPSIKLNPIEDAQLRQTIAGQIKQRLIDAENRKRIDLAVRFALTEGVSPSEITDILKRDYISITSTDTSDQIIGNLHGAIKNERDKRLRAFAMIVLPQKAKDVGVPETDIRRAKSPEELVTLITTQERKNQLKACFAAGTMLYTPQGYRAIESLRVGEMVFSRAEEDPTSEISAKRVEEVFVHTGRIWVLKVNGREIRTTGEHPFWVRDRGWVNACDLVEGNRLLSHDGQWVVVDAIEDTNRYETVYNLRIADYHTYFVGGDDWGFNVWAHNACIGVHDTSPAAAKAIITSGLVNPPAWVQPFGGTAADIDGPLTAHLLKGGAGTGAAQQGTSLIFDIRGLISDRSDVNGGIGFGKGLPVPGRLIATVPDAGNPAEVAAAVQKVKAHFGV